MKPWQKYLIVAVLTLFLIWAISRLVRPSAYGVPISVAVYRMKTHWRKRYRRRSLEDIDMVVIHHSLTEGGTARSFSEYHVEENDWAGIGYHYVVYKDGRIEQTQFLATVSNHTSGQNTRSVGICLVGNYDIEQPPAAQIESAVKLIAHLEDKLGRQLEIDGHNDYSSKSCPGAAVNVNAIENAVRDLKKAA